MKITALMENSAARPDCRAEHGLSILIETGKHVVLFDAGASAQFAQNAAALGVDLGAVDTAVLSHGHYDHSGGMTEFFRRNAQAKLYARAGFELARYNKTGKYIGVEPRLTDHPRVVPVTAERLELDEQLTIVHWGGEPCVRPIDSCGMKAESCAGSPLVDELFDHEQYLIVSEGNKRVLFSGCSHRGILNIMNWSRGESVCAVIGGFHFKDLDPSAYGTKLSDAAAELARYPVTYYSCHCTGEAPFAFLKECLWERLQPLHAGQVITF